MSSLSGYLSDHWLAILLRLLIIFVCALLLSRLFRKISGRLVRQATGTSRSEQAREQQTRVLADYAYRLAACVVWLVAGLMGLAQLGVNPLPAIALAAVIGLALGLGAQHLVRDLIAGFYIVWEDQYAAGETVEIGGVTGKVEQLTLRRTVLRDARGALLTIANGEARMTANLSREWSQAFVEISVAPELGLEKPLAALESAAAALRTDSAWSQALVDGPRVLGLQEYGRGDTVIRLAVKTLPLRQDEVSRELRRRIHIEFQKQAIPVPGAAKVDPADPAGARDGMPPVDATI
ncbi:MAG TPA: mechanosensitive ion channel family protein [Candidatus Acidoferrum sp.]|nr:mechanosensitive ion channel family protein [Candidatus Acidoferrum sp.]